MHSAQCRNKSSSSAAANESCRNLAIGYDYVESSKNSTVEYDYVDPFHVINFTRRHSPGMHTWITRRLFIRHSFPHCHHFRKMQDRQTVTVTKHRVQSYTLQRILFSEDRCQLSYNLLCYNNGTCNASSGTMCPSVTPALRFHLV